MREFFNYIEAQYLDKIDIPTIIVVAVLLIIILLPKKS